MIANRFFIAHSPSKASYEGAAKRCEGGRQITRLRRLSKKATEQVDGKETASWLCVLAAAPVAVAGFFSYNSLTLEQFLWALLKFELLCAGGRRFVSENFHYTLLARKEDTDLD
ncbi:MAG: PrgI family protein [Oscillospiraceae bacterium]|nr:PrgI family protein [Oscillospiraceae bacterium]